ncbi:MAG: hypothetical protein QOF58_201, partial [Pseudonocardiales bacterium]|nr:hypothetical protein [Pseudonocardiales bacterium]
MRALPLLLAALLLAPVPATAQPAPVPEPFKIGFSSLENDDQDIFTVDSLGNARTNLTKSPRINQEDPAFSLDGTKLAYVDDFDRIVIANADGTNPKRLNAETREQSQPAWSPDGTMIAATTRIVEGESSRTVIQIHRVPDGAKIGEIPIPEHLTGNDSAPDWSPDGRTIAITRRAENVPPPTPPTPVPDPDTDLPARQGSTFDLTQVVHTPRIPPKPDVVILIDISGSMRNELDSVKRTLTGIIDDVKKVQPETQFGIASYAGPENEGRTFDVHVPLQPVVGEEWKKKVTVIEGEDSTEVWAHALIRTATDAFDFRPDSSRVVVVIGDEGTAERKVPPAYTDTIDNALAALKAKNIRFVGVDSGGLNEFGQAKLFKEETGGSLKTFDETKPGEISTAITDGIKDLAVTVTPVAKCDTGLGVVLTPPGPVEG